MLYAQGKMMKCFSDRLVFVAFFSLAYCIFVPLPLLGDQRQIICTPDYFPPNKRVMDGCGYDFKAGKFEELPTTEAWSKMRIKFFDSSPPQVEIYGSILSSEEFKDTHTTQLISTDKDKTTFLYEQNSDMTSGIVRNTWLLSYFPSSDVLYLSLQSFDTLGAERLNTPPIIRGQVFKAQCFREK